MTRLDERRATALEKWQAFEDNSLPMVLIGSGTCGLAAGAMEVREAVKQSLADLKIEARIVEVGCIGPCYLEPLMDVKLPGKPRVSYGNVTAKRVDSILRGFFVDGKVPTDHVIGHFGQEGAVDSIPRFFDHPMSNPRCASFSGTAASSTLTIWIITLPEMATGHSRWSSGVPGRKRSTS